MMHPTDCEKELHDVWLASFSLRMASLLLAVAGVVSASCSASCPLHACAPTQMPACNTPPLPPAMHRAFHDWEQQAKSFRHEAKLRLPGYALRHLLPSPLPPYPWHCLQSTFHRHSNPQGSRSTLHSRRFLRSIVLNGTVAIFETVMLP